MRYLLSLLACCALFAACKSEQKTVTPRASERVSLRPPIEGVDVSFTYVSVPAAAGDVFTYRSGTRIAIPSDAFVDAIGNPVKGEVEVQYREFRDAADIFLAGIPMAYDSAGLHGNFTSAGMFEIRAMQNGKEVFLAPNRNIEVRMASHTGGGEYNFYQLGQDLSWKYEGNTAPEVNFKKQEIRNWIKSHTPEKVGGEKYFCFNYGQALDVFYENASNASEKGDRNNVFGKKVKQYGLRCLQYDAWDDVSFMGVEYPACMLVWKRISGEPLPRWADSSSKMIFLARGSQYELRLLSPNKQILATAMIEAVMPLKSFFAHSPAYWETNFASGMAEVKKQQAQLHLEAEVYRTFQVTKLGIYNWDKMKNNIGAMAIAGTFDFGKAWPQDSTLAQKMVYLFPGDNQSVVKYPETDWKDKLYLAPDNGARIVAVLPGRKVAVFPAVEYAKIPFDKLRTAPKPAYTFPMTPTIATISSSEDFRKIVGL